MDYQNKSRGISIVELIVVLAIVGLLFEIGTSTYNNFKSHSNLEVATGGLVEAIRLAQSSSQSGRADSKWGVKILQNQVVVFSGDSYALRDTTYDQPLGFSGEITSSGLSEIVFEKVSGVTTMVGTTTLSNGSESNEIYINEKGTVTY